MLKKDVPEFKRMLIRHKDETLEFLKGDSNDIYEAFLYEMENHEYAINWTADEDVLDCFYLSIDDLKTFGLDLIYSSARRRYFELAMENDWY